MFPKVGVHAHCYFSMLLTGRGVSRIWCLVQFLRFFVCLAIVRLLGVGCRRPNLSCIHGVKSLFGMVRYERC